MSIGVGVVGLGFMGRTHLRAYRWAAGSGEACRVVGVCDVDAARLGGSPPTEGNLGGAAEGPAFEPGELAVTPSLEALLDLPGLDAVSVCTPTDTHVEVATAALRAGKHVLVEKPVALSSAGVAALRREAEVAGRLCVPAMCMRHWPAWAWVRGAVAEGRFGPVRAVRAERLGAAPSWSRGFYADTARSGGALLDLHVHDADWIVDALGRPEEVLAVGDRSHVTAVYRYAHGPGQVVARGGWMRAASVGFVMRLLVEFESAVADFELGRDPELIVHGAGGAASPPLEAISAWEAQARAFLRAVRGGSRVGLPTLGQAEAVLGVLEAEARSLESGRAEQIA